MKKSLATFLSAAMIASFAIPVLAGGNLNVSGQHEIVYEKQPNLDLTSGKFNTDPLITNKLQLDLNGNLTDKVTMDARLLLSSEYSTPKSSDLHMVLLPGFLKIEAKTMNITMKDSLTHKSRYELTYLKGTNATTSADPMTTIYNVGSGTDIVETRLYYGSNDEHYLRAGLFNGVAGRWYAEYLGEYTPELKVGALLNTEYLPGLDKVKYPNTYNKPVFSSYTNSVYASYKPQAIDGLEITGGIYFTKSPGPTARPTGGIGESETTLSLPRELTRKYGLGDEVFDKGYYFVLRGRATDWGGGNWDTLNLGTSRDVLVKEEDDDSLTINWADVRAMAAKINRNNPIDLAWDNLGTFSDGGFKIVVFDKSGKRVDQFDNNQNFADFVTEPNAPKKDGSAGVLIAKYQKGKVDSTLSIKTLGKDFDARSTNFYGKEYGVPFDDSRREFKFPIEYNGTYSLYEAYDDYTHVLTDSSYDITDDFNVGVYAAYKKAEDTRTRTGLTAISSVTGNTIEVVTAADDCKFDYYAIGPNFHFNNFKDAWNFEGKVLYERTENKVKSALTYTDNGETKDVPADYQVSDASGTAQLISGEFRIFANSPFPYLNYFNFNYKERDVAKDTGTFEDRRSGDGTRSELFIEARGEKLYDDTIIPYAQYRLESWDVDDAKTPRRATLVGDLKYEISNLSLELQNKYVYDRGRFIASDNYVPWNWVITEINYKLPEYNIETKLMGKYNTIAKNNCDNDASMYAEIKKFFNGTSTIALKYGDDASFYDHDKNQTQLKKTRLEYTNRF